MQELLEKRFREGVALLRELSKNGVVVVVEGQKDIAALQRIGVTGPIISLSGHNVVALAELLAGKNQVLILFDFDTRGEQLTKLLITQLHGTGTKIHHDVRKKLRKAFSWQSRVIEGLRLPNGTSDTTKF
jgi:5S rRNA maturation endonuclease (ribonuclease M5)